jgi:hypothetical protein
MDIGVAGAIHKEGACHLTVSSIGSGPIEAQKPLADQVFKLGRRGAGGEIAERLALEFCVGGISGDNVTRQFLNVIKTSKERGICGNRLKVRHFCAVNRSTVLSASQKGNDIGSVDQAIEV